MSDEFDHIADDFADIQDVDWDHLLSGSTGSALSRAPSYTEIPATTPVRPPSANSSTRYSSDGDLDPTFLEELDVLEQSITQNTTAISGVCFCSTTARVHDLAQTAPSRPEPHASGSGSSCRYIDCNTRLYFDRLTYQRGRYLVRHIPFLRSLLDCYARSTISRAAGSNLPASFQYVF